MSNPLSARSAREWRAERDAAGELPLTRPDFSDLAAFASPSALEPLPLAPPTPLHDLIRSPPLGRCFLARLKASRRNASAPWLGGAVRSRGRFTCIAAARGRLPSIRSDAPAQSVFRDHRRFRRPQIDGGQRSADPGADA